MRNGDVYKSDLYKSRGLQGVVRVHVCAKSAFQGTWPGDLYIETRPDRHFTVQAGLEHPDSSILQCSRTCTLLVCTRKVC